jgi:hypothetical protein
MLQKSNEKNNSKEIFEKTHLVFFPAKMEIAAQNDFPSKSLDFAKTFKNILLIGSIHVFSSKTNWPTDNLTDTLLDRNSYDLGRPDRLKVLFVMCGRNVIWSNGFHERFFVESASKGWRQNTQYNDSQLNNTQLNDTQHIDARYFDTQHNDIH